MVLLCALKQLWLLVQMVGWSADRWLILLMALGELNGWIVVAAAAAVAGSAVGRCYCYRWDC